MKNKIKKSVALLLVFSLLFCSFSVVSAAAEYVSGNYTYTVSGGKATITAYPETAKGSVKIPSELNGYKVTAIDKNAFFGCTLVTEIEIPDTVKSIGNYAFAYCTSLTKITVPSSVTSIGNNAFKNSKNVVVYAPKDSTAYKYAVRNSIKVVEVEDTKDSDGDGIIDTWEINGIDVDGDGVLELDLPSMGADPNVPDIFVEVDWMVRPAKKFLFWETSPSYSFKPSESVMRLVYNAFAEHGINIHLDVGPESTDFVTGRRWGSLANGNEIEYKKSLKVDKNYQIWNDLLDISEIRTLVFHHCIFADFLFKDTSNTTSGITPDFGQYFAVTLGGWGTVSDMTIAGTFMHELGHSLGLRHGGCDHEHYKPNYLSIMNYAFQTTGIAGTNELNYSDYKLPDINESNVNEFDGIDPSGLTLGTNLATTVFYRTSSQITTGAIARESIDFNGNGTLENSISIDLNPGGNVYDSPLAILRGHNDWIGINYKSGLIGSGTKIDEIPAAQVSEGATLGDEKTLEESLETATLATDGTGCIELVASTIVKDVNNQYIYFDVINLGVNDATFLVKINGSILMEAYCQNVTVRGSKTQIEKTRIAVPVNAMTDEGRYLVDCSISFEGKKDVKETFAITVYAPSQDELNELKKLLSEDAHMDIDSDILEQIVLVIDSCEEKETYHVKAKDLALDYKTTANLLVDVDGIDDYSTEYETSNIYIASVDKEGTVTATGVGTAEITVTVTDEYGNVVEDTCTVTVSYAWWQWLIVIFLFGWIWY